ncbi:hypothetical protein U9M48_040949 [Paspalum notatum var. saurae]|uniref:Phytocyanin domain-containing protein n=1 Tax=Paspalum notatum var. saurae TaxID=547442 RepID=A0AAQ3UPB8_PASNO
MAATRALFLVAVAMAAVLGTAHGASYNVGAPAGSWDLATNYTLWASGITFRAGDQLVFKYPRGAHNVMEVSKAGYDACSTTAPLSTASTGDDTVPVPAAGVTRYFICGVPGHCAGGMKLAVTVAASNAAAPAPNAAAPSPAPVAIVRRAAARPSPALSWPRECGPPRPRNPLAPKRQLGVGWRRHSNWAFTVRRREPRVARGRRPEAEMNGGAATHPSGPRRREAFMAIDRCRARSPPPRAGPRGGRQEAQDEDGRVVSADHFAGPRQREASTAVRPRQSGQQPRQVGVGASPCAFHACHVELSW